MEQKASTARESRHPIKVVARRTRLSPDLLRIWEKRYQAVVPGRTPTGRRIYSDADIERLRLLREATSGGRRIGDIALLTDKELAALIEEDRRAEDRSAESAQGEPRSKEAAAYLDESLLAARSLDAHQLQTTLRRALFDLSLDELIEDLIAPLLRAVGEMWAAHDLSPYHEHLASTLIRQTLGQILAAAIPDEPAPVMLATTPKGQRHEIGAILASLVALAESWRVVYLGPDLPATDIARASKDTGASVVALSVVYPEDDPELGDELRRLRESLPEDVVIVVGGGAAPAYWRVLEKVGAIMLSDVRALRPTLSSIRGRKEHEDGAARD